MRARTPEPGADSKSEAVGTFSSRLRAAMLAAVLDGRGESEHLAFVSGVERDDPLDVRDALGQRAGLVERDHRCPTQLLHHHCRFHQDSVPARSGHRGEQRRHRREHDGAGRGDDHERHRPQQRRLQFAPERHRNPEDRRGGTDDGLGVVLLDLVDEQLLLGLGGRGVLDRRDDAGENGVRRVDVDPHPQRPGAVDGAREHLVADASVDRNRLPGYRGLVDVAVAFDDSPLSRDALAWTHKNHVTGAQRGGIDLVLVAVLRDNHGGLRGEIEEAANRVGGALRQYRLEGSGCREDDDEQSTVEDLPDCCGPDCRDDHQEVDVECPVSQSANALERRLPTSGDVARQVEGPVHPGRGG